MPLPDHDRIMAQVQHTAEEARERLESRPTPPNVPNPIISAPAHEGVPTEYVLIVSTQLCDKCGCGETSSQFFARYVTLGRHGTPLLKHLRACGKPEYNLPVKRVNNPPSRVPFCSECEDFDLSHLQSPPEPTRLTPPEMLMRGQKPKEPKPAPKKATLDDLI